MTTCTLREIDSRHIDRGQGIEVKFLVGDSQACTVELTKDGTPLSQVYVGTDGAAALDAYLHPFARAHVASVWS